MRYSHSLSKDVSKSSMSASRQECRRETRIIAINLDPPHLCSIWRGAPDLLFILYCTSGRHLQVHCNSVSYGHRHRRNEPEERIPAGRGNVSVNEFMTISPLMMLALMWRFHCNSQVLEAHERLHPILHLLQPHLSDCYLWKKFNV